MNPTTFTPTESELRTLQAQRQRIEWKMRDYRRMSSEYELARYNHDFGNHWFDADSKRFFGSRIGGICHGQSPADWNIFISSEKNSSLYSSIEYPRRYTVRQLQIDGSVEDLSQFQQYSTSAQARRAIEKYLALGTPFFTFMNKGE